MVHPVVTGVAHRAQDGVAECYTGCRFGKGAPLRNIYVTAVSRRFVAACNVPLYSMQRALYSMQRALYSMQRALYSVQRALCNVPLYSMQRALYSI